MSAEATNAATIRPGLGFAEPVFDAARAFRAVLDAMARPGTIVTPPTPEAPPQPMGPAMAAVLLTLCDADTPICIEPPFATPEVHAFAAFHTGAPRTHTATAAFVFCNGIADLSSLAQGEQAYPDRSATVVCEVAGLAQGGDTILSGPGIDGTRAIRSSLLDAGFVAQWARNNARFPRGVDLIMTCGTKLAAVPRTTRIVTGG